MKRPTIINGCVVAALMLMLAACLPAGLAAAELPGGQALNKELQKDVGMPVLNGDLWVKMSHDSKVAFLWGIWHVATIEHYLMGKYPDLKKENFSAKLIEGSGKTPMTMNEMVALIDTYYKSDPDEIETPVVAVIWSSIITPNIKTGIDGRPLKP